MIKSPVGNLSERIVAEFREMPGTRLTVAQAARLWALDGSDAAQALQRLERTGVLTRTPQGAYVLRSDK
jgi:DNA-binding GntR family transcriptional regulator